MIRKKTRQNLRKKTNLFSFSLPRNFNPSAESLLPASQDMCRPSAKASCLSIPPSLHATAAGQGELVLAGPWQCLLSPPPQNQLLLYRSQQAGPPRHCWAEHPSPRPARLWFLFLTKRPKPAIFLQDRNCISQYREERTVCSQHAVRSLTLSVIRIFIHFDPSRRSRWLFNACLSLSFSKLHHIIMSGKCNEHYKHHCSLPLPSHPALLLPKGRTMQHGSFPSSLAPRHQLQRPRCIFPLPTPLDKTPTFPTQTPSF